MIATIHEVVETSLPCDPAVILGTDPVIDPAGYSLYPAEQVEASKAYDRCMVDARELFEAKRVMGRVASTNWILIVLADLVAAALVFSGWTLGVALNAPRWVLHLLSLLTVVAVVAAGFQVRYSDTIDLVTWITN